MIIKKSIIVHLMYRGEMRIFKKSWGGENSPPPPPTSFCASPPGCLLVDNILTD